MERGSDTTTFSGKSIGNSNLGDCIVMSEKFPEGLRVLLVDDNPSCQRSIEKILKKCLYEVTICVQATHALAMLQEKIDRFDIVLTDVFMPDMDGFKLLEHIAREMADLPVIMMSADDRKDLVMKSINHGACDYLIKPLRLEVVKNIWQHVVRKRINNLEEWEKTTSSNYKPKKILDDNDDTSPINEVNEKQTKRRKDERGEEYEVEERDDTSTSKKPRLVWSPGLHLQFVNVVQKLGVHNAVPKKILEMMNISGLTRENVASHLQKYRSYLKRWAKTPENQGGLDATFAADSEAKFSSIDPCDEICNLSMLQVGDRRIPRTEMEMSSDESLCFLNFEAQAANSSNMNLLYTPLPATMEPSQVAYSQRAVESYGNMGIENSKRVSDFPGFPSSVEACPSSRVGSFHGPQNSDLLIQTAPTVLPNEMAQNALRSVETTEIAGSSSGGGAYMNNSSYCVLPDPYVNFQKTCITRELPEDGCSLSSTLVELLPSEAIPATGSPKKLDNAFGVNDESFSNFCHEDFPSVDNLIPNELHKCNHKAGNWSK